MSRLLRLSAAIGLAGLVATGLAAPALAASAADVLAAAGKKPTDTLTVQEAIDLGTKLFSAINPDGDTTLEPDETEGRLTKKDWAKVNKDGDQTLEMDEWLGIVRARFNAADKNKDGKLTVKELDSKAGQQLILVLVK
ncbi:hypothetical protein MWN34_06850 [Ancylobacter sp. 6x-1]|uniref:EF-hand domain-containing protein n=1 Tax=Ancylobacter crimeensis TaxID=2579147 RepID=A0ABT0D9K4_9HYPH|nr:hypothetical protein [Ancylobacter crimeensis]MCK0196631.1 hypothetical protein [Ancylobacter crimeensis]